jgi:hypothetical protein
VRKRRSYDEGDWFGVPLERGGFGVGLAARVGRRSGVAFGYFFGPKRDELPALRELDELEADDAVFAGRFYDDSLRNGTWPTIGRCEPWSRDRWPMPAFLTQSGMPGTPNWRVVCAEDDPNQEVETTEISAEEAAELLPDSVYGEGVVEARLTELLDGSAVGADEERDGRGRDSREARFYLYFATREIARMAAAELERESYAVRVEGPLDEPAERPFLVLAAREFDAASADADVEAAEELMERVAAAHDGDYDGLEREVG